MSGSIPYKLSTGVSYSGDVVFSLCYVIDSETICDSLYTLTYANNCQAEISVPGDLIQDELGNVISDYNIDLSIAEQSISYYLNDGAVTSNCNDFTYSISDTTDSLTLEKDESLDKYKITWPSDLATPGQSENFKRDSSVTVSVESGAQTKTFTLSLLDCGIRFRNPPYSN